MTEPIKCPICGENNNPNLAVCWKCKRNLETGELAQGEVTESSKKKWYKNNSQLAWSIFAVAVFVGSGARLIELLKGDTSRVEQAFSSTLEFWAATLGLLTNIGFDPITWFALFLLFHLRSKIAAWTITIILGIPTVLTIIAGQLLQTGVLQSK